MLVGWLKPVVWMRSVRSGVASPVAEESCTVTQDVHSVADGVCPGTREAVRGRWLST